MGTLGTTVAVIAVASIGFMLLAGRVSIRHALTVIVGCFILFGSRTIVSGIRASLGDYASAAPVTPSPPPPPDFTPPPPANPDPYAGASVPVR